MKFRTPPDLPRVCERDSDDIRKIIADHLADLGLTLTNLPDGSAVITPKETTCLH